MVNAVTDYWNHNAAHHPRLLAIADRLRGNALDVGCGEGLLAQRLAVVSTSVTAIDPAADSVQRARNRLAGRPRVTLHHNIFEDLDAHGQKFDLVTFMASMHYLDSRRALTKARELLTPTGEIAVIGLSANHPLGD
jgi:2-polyprenyl-3-methyl-5-hydroxy-6-metoxy-1,4-benzoquinol methylase